MDVMFDGANKLILPQEPTGVLSVKAMYSSWKEWVLDNMEYEQAFITVGGDPITAENNIPTYYYLINDWRIKWPSNSNIAVEVHGNILVYGGLDTPYLPVDSGYSSTVTSVVATNDKLTEEELHSMLDNYINKDMWKANVEDGVAAIDGKVNGLVTATDVIDSKVTQLRNYDDTIINSKLDAITSDISINKTDVINDINGAIDKINNVLSYMPALDVTNSGSIYSKLVGIVNDIQEVSTGIDNIADDVYNKTFGRVV